MFDASVVTCMTGWFETEFEIETISLAILNKFLTAVFMYFIIVSVWNVLLLPHVGNYFIILIFWYRTSQYIYFLISTNLIY